LSLTHSPLTRTLGMHWILRHLILRRRSAVVDVRGKQAGVGGEERGIPKRAKRRKHPPASGRPLVITMSYGQGESTASLPNAVIGALSRSLLELRHTITRCARIFIQRKISQLNSSLYYFIISPSEPVSLSTGSGCRGTGCADKLMCMKV
jgi:hypothetical protein